MIVRSDGGLVDDAVLVSEIWGKKLAAIVKNNLNGWRIGKVSCKGPGMELAGISSGLGLEVILSVISLSSTVLKIVKSCEKLDG